MKKFFSQIYKIVVNRWFVLGWFILSFGIYLALVYDRTISHIINWNISCSGYNHPTLFLIWTISLSVFYFLVMLSLKNKYKTSIVPVILSLIGVAAFLVTGLLVPPKDQGENFYMICLFIHCGFAALFAVLNYVALCLTLLFRYKKCKEKKYKNLLLVMISLSIPFIVILCIWPMAGYTELLPIVFTIFVCIILILEQPSSQEKLIDEN